MLRPCEINSLNFIEEETIIARIPCKGKAAPCKITFEYYADNGDVHIYTSNKCQNPNENQYDFKHTKGRVPYINVPNDNTKGRTY